MAFPCVYYTIFTYDGLKNKSTLFNLDTMASLDMVHSSFSLFTLPVRSQCLGHSVVDPILNKNKVSHCQELNVATDGYIPITSDPTPRPSPLGSGYTASQWA